MKTHRNIPFFVPHAGCPHCCVFCSQVKITGHSADKDIDTELLELKELLESSGRSGGVESRIAFFGGSFTAIERTRMVALLSTANEYIKKGVASGIRISTRPDCIDEEILDLLKKYSVTDIELGIQSTDNKVLIASERGHTAEDSFKAAELVKRYGFTLGGQMMIGLPESTKESELQTARDIISMHADEARIYPTVVFENTKLCDMTKSGGYTPLTTDEAVDRTAECFKLFVDAGVKMLKIGLHASENLANAPYGATHPAIGELVKSRVYADGIIEKAGKCEGKIISIRQNRRDISMLTGNYKAELKRIKEITGAKETELITADIPRFETYVTVINTGE